jgi:iron complex transport system ATP-binding protein
VKLTADALTLGFPGRTLCSGLSFAIAPGQCWAVLGNNGSGKTTLMHVLSGIRSPLAGTVRADGSLLTSLGAAARAQRVGLLLQEEPAPLWGNVLDYVALGRYPHRRSMLGRDPEAEQLARAHLERMDLGPLAGRSLATLSGGERQRARLTLVLTQDPLVYLLDEPLQHLDLRHQLQTLDCFTALAHSAGRAVVMALHDPEIARRRCDHAVLLYDAESPLAGPAERVLTSDNLERLYGVPLPL